MLPEHQIQRSAGSQSSDHPPGPRQKKEDSCQCEESECDSSCYEKKEQEQPTKFCKPSSFLPNQINPFCASIVGCDGHVFNPQLHQRLVY